MASATAKILEEARQLPASEQLHLVDQLLAELDLPDPTIESLWAEEAQRRSDAVKDGSLPHKPLAEVLHKYRN